MIGGFKIENLFKKREIILNNMRVLSSSSMGKKPRGKKPRGVKPVKTCPVQLAMPDEFHKSVL